MTSRELVKNTLEFCNRDGRAPRQLWLLPWAEMTYPQQVAEIQARFPSDFAGCPVEFTTPPKTVGDAYAVGEYTDEWGCVFQNLHAGIIGEVKEPIIREEDEEWEDLSRVHFPQEWLSFDRDAVNAFCKSSDKFVMAGCNPRPFERLQFLRGTSQLYIDLMLRPQGMMRFIQRLHTFYCDLMERWAQTDVDALSFMDDWGSQNSLLIHPDVWCEIFKPMYRDYIEIAHRAGKKAFMHSDGNTLQIYPHLIDIGLDAINSQLFCIGVDRVEEFAGSITFWGEIDRQHLLPQGTVDEIDQAVRQVHQTLWRQGGCIAQCEFGPGAKPENVRQVFASWDAVTGQ